ncbi:ATP-NAD kinase-like domain-containing protein [Blastocladiella britannica]|nr:ATP-NAD kinase-like domain-containing protein [Blastocladiella britannica]
MGIFTHTCITAIATLPVTAVLALARSAANGTPLPRFACRDRLSATAAALRAVPATDGAANRCVSVHLLRQPGAASSSQKKKSKDAEPMIEFSAPRLESWTFAAKSEADAVAARATLREWLACPDRAAAGERALVMVNPNAGAREGRRILHKVVEPILSIAGVEADTHITERILHATEIARSFNARAYSMALLVGGDGVVHEFWHGLLTHPSDSGSVSTLPVAHIAAGSGNGLAASLNLLPPERAMLAALHGHTAPLDLFEYRMTSPTDNQQLDHGFGHLSFTHGLIADIDMDSEVLRALGPLRMEVYSLLRIFAQRQYGIKYAYVAPENEARARAAAEAATGSTNLAFVPWEEQTEASGWTRVPAEAILTFMVQNLPMISSDVNFSPLAHHNDGLLRLLVGPKLPTSTLLRTFLDTPSGRVVTLPGMRYVPAVAVSMQPVHPSNPGFAAGDVTDTAAWAKACRAGGHMVVDGEVVPFGNMVMQVRPRTARVVVPHNYCPAAYARSVVTAGDGVGASARGGSDLEPPISPNYSSFAAAEAANPAEYRRQFQPLSNDRDVKLPAAVSATDAGEHVRLVTTTGRKEDRARTRSKSPGRDAAPQND